MVSADQKGEYFIRNMSYSFQRRVKRCIWTKNADSLLFSDHLVQVSTSLSQQQVRKVRITLEQPHRFQENLVCRLALNHNTFSFYSLHEKTNIGEGIQILQSRTAISTV